jgi:hypothetical protein
MICFELSTGSPETVESLFIAYRLTGDPRYREHGWSIFQAIERHCRVESGGYASVLNVDALPVTHEDKMETFLMVSSLPSCLVGARGLMCGGVAERDLEVPVLVVRGR